MKKTINRSARDTMISRHNVKMVVGGIRRRGYSDVVFFFCSENIPSWTRGYRFWFILPSDLSVSRLGKVFLRLDTKIANTPLKLAYNDIVYFKLSFQLPLAIGLDRCTPALSFGSQYPTPWIWFLIPHRSTFVFNTPLSDFRFSYPYAHIWFSIPLSRTFVFGTLCWNFVLLYHFKSRFLVQFPYPVSFYFSVRFDRFLFVKINFILMILNVYYIIQKIVKFLSEMSVFCQNLWYNVYSDIWRVSVTLSLPFRYHFLLSYSW